MASEAILRIKVIADTAAAAAGLGKVDNSTSKMRSGLAKAALPAAAATAAIAAFGAASVDAASRAQQAMGGVDAVFGKSAKQVHKWAESSATDVGLATSEYEELATVLGAQLKNAGLPMEEVAKKTKGLIKTGADLSAQFGGSAKEAVEALSSALRGETDPIEKYGVAVKSADIENVLAAEHAQRLAKAQADLAGPTGKLTKEQQKQAEAAAALTPEQEKQAKTAALLGLVTKQTADAQGAFARESDTAAGQAQRTSAQMENMQASLGAALLPALSAATAALGALFGFMEKHTTTTQIVIAAIAALAAVIVILNIALTITAALGTTISLPFILLVVAVVAVIAAFVLLYNKVTWFREAVQAVFAGIKTAVAGVARFLVSTWANAVGAVKGTVKGVQTIWETVSGAVKTAISTVTNWLEGKWRDTVNAVKAIIGGVEAKWDDAVAAIRGLIDDVTGFLESKWSGAVDTVKSIIGTLATKAESVFQGVQNAIDKVWNVFRTLGSKIQGMLSDSGTWLKQIGVNIVQGLVSGINSVIHWVQDAVQALADKIPGWVKKRLGIGSPSKVMKAIGRDIMAGLGLGMEEMSAEVEAISTAIADRITKRMTNAFQAAALAKLPKKATDKQRERALEMAANKAEKLSKKTLKSLKDEYAALDANVKAREANAAALEEQQGILDQLISQQESYAASVTQSANAYAALTTATVAEDEAFTSAGLIANMAARVKAVEDFKKTLDDLRAAGLSEQTLADLTAAGVETGGAMASALAAGGPAAVAEVNSMQGQLDAASTALGTNAATGLYGAGVVAQQGLVDGLALDQETLNTAAVTLANDLKNAVSKALEDADVNEAAEAYAKRLAKAIRKALKAALAKDKDDDGGGGGNGSGTLSLVPAMAANSVAPAVANPAVASAGRPVAGPTIVVNGAIDPEATARQIRRILAGHDRRMGLAG